MKDRETVFSLRQAMIEDNAVLEELIAASVRILQASDYSEEQRERALRTLYGVDTQLIRDQTYFAVEAAGIVVGCGGWSRRKTLFGGDLHRGREDAFLDPATDAARIRAFFVRPGWERRGIGTAILAASETAAAAASFTRLELGSTLTGVPFYRAHGYREAEPIEVPLGQGITLTVVRMTKTLNSGANG
jgi:GNAT superfamily N-acetyltransferase